MSKKTIIVGGGIAGLTTAYQLNKHGVKAQLFEASDRLGGRIFTKAINGLKYELGATWVFEDPYLKSLIQELGLQLYPQYLKGDALIKYSPTIAIQKSPTESLMNGALYHKLIGGTGAIIDALERQLDSDQVRLNMPVNEIEYNGVSIKVKFLDGSEQNADHVILALPPKRISENIKIKPSIDPEELMKNTQTWMGESAKFTVLFDRDHWREQGLSGFVYSNFGLIREAQDHQSEDGKSIGLVGFIQAEGALRNSFHKRKEAVFMELHELLGIQEENILDYEDFLWLDHFKDSKGENFNSDLIPHQNNGHSFYSRAYFDGRLVFAGAETSPTNPGYMEGAVRSVYRAIELLDFKFLS